MDAIRWQLGKQESPERVTTRTADWGAEFSEWQAFPLCWFLLNERSQFIWLIYQVKIRWTGSQRSIWSGQPGPRCQPSLEMHFPNQSLRPWGCVCVCVCVCGCVCMSLFIYEFREFNLLKKLQEEGGRGMDWEFGVGTCRSRSNS